MKQQQSIVCPWVSSIQTWRFHQPLHHHHSRPCSSAPLLFDSLVHVQCTVKLTSFLKTIENRCIFVETCTVYTLTLVDCLFRKTELRYWPHICFFCALVGVLVYALHVTNIDTFLALFLIDTHIVTYTQAVIKLTFFSDHSPVILYFRFEDNEHGRVYGNNS